LVDSKGGQYWSRLTIIRPLFGSEWPMLERVRMDGMEVRDIAAEFVGRISFWIIIFQANSADFCKKLVG
jgi:hypothetical protein